MLCGVALYAVLLRRARSTSAGIRGDGLATLFYVANWHTILRGHQLLGHLAGARRRSSTRGRWRSRSSSTWCGRSSCTPSRASPAPVRHASWAGCPSVWRPCRRCCSSASTARVRRYTRIYEGTDTRAAALLLGAAWAAWRAWVAGRFSPTRHRARRCRRRVWSSATPGGRSRAPRRSSTAAGCPSAASSPLLVVAAACQPPSPVLGRAFAIRPLRWLGPDQLRPLPVALAVYLVLDEQRLGYGGLPLLLTVRLVVTLAVALASYYVLERPIRRGRSPAADGGAFMFAGGIAIALVAILVSTRGGVDVGDIVAATSARRRSSFRASRRCCWSATRRLVGGAAGRRGPEGVRRQPDQRDPHRLLRDRGRARLRELRRRRGPQPAALLGEDTPRWWPRHDPDLAVVLLGARPNDYIKVDGKWQRAATPATTASTTTGSVSGSPISGRPGPRSWSPRSPSPGRTAFRIEGGDSDRACVNQMIDASLGRPNVTVLDMDELLCPDSKCIEELDGDPSAATASTSTTARAASAASRLVLDRARALYRRQLTDRSRGSCALVDLSDGAGSAPPG